MNQRDIFIEAMQKREGDERSAFLDVACGDDVELRESVEQLLAEHQKDDSFFLDGPPPGLGATVDVPEITEKSGAQIGPFKLLQQIGEGGMGAVFMAKQTEPVDRRVALKVIKPGMDSQQVIARFEAERQALAMMDHPNVAKVLDAGTTDSGRPYFVMELVKGQPITQYCDEHHLTPRARLELFLPVCRAIQHAHQKGIIHRDIKPTNILVAEFDEKAVPKVIDFGVAKAIGQSLTEKTMFTGLGQIVGTLEYMSPEQAKVNQLDIDTRSDVYSLGVLLYELLTGSTPLDKQRLRSAAWDEILRIIREEEPEKPSTRLSQSNTTAQRVRPDSGIESTTLASIAALRNTEPARLSKLVRGELDWIVMKALEKDRNRRYDTANAFAADVQHYLNNEAVVACPPSAAYRFRKFTRRNSVLIGTTAVVAASLIIGTSIATWQAIRATHEATRATNAEALAELRYDAEKNAREQADNARAAESRQRRIAQDETRRAEENFDKARRAVDEYLTQVTESELLTVPGMQSLREDLLEAALKFYAEFTHERADDPTIQRELASAHFRLGRIHSELGDKVSSRAGNNEAIRLFEKLRDTGTVDLELQVALARAYYFSQRFEDVISICQNVLNAEPENAEAASLLADTYITLAVENRYDIASALNYYQQAFELGEALVSRAPDNLRYQAHLGYTLTNLGVILKDRGNLDQALTMYERANEYSRQAYEREPHSLLWGGSLCIGLGNLAEVQAMLGREQEALATYQRLVDVSRKRTFENPAVPSLQGGRCVALMSLARYQQQLGDTGEADRSFREAREVLDNIPRETPDQLYELAKVYATLAAPVKRASGPTEEEVAEQERNIELAIQTLHHAIDAGFKSPQALRSNQEFDWLRKRKDFQQILTMLEAGAMVQPLASPNSGSDEQTLAEKLRAAELLTDTARKRPGALQHKSALAATLHSIGVIQIGLKQFDEADKSLHEALRIRRELLETREDDPEMQFNCLSTRSVIGQLLVAAGHYPEAHRLWSECLAEFTEIADKHRGNNSLQQRFAAEERGIFKQYGEIGLWELSVQHSLRNVSRARTSDVIMDARFALLLLATGRVDEHRQYGEILHDRWKQASSTGVLEHVLWVVGMNPNSTVDRNEMTILADKVVAQADNAFSRTVAASAYFHMGEYQQALAILQPTSRYENSEQYAAYLLAMLYHKLDDTQKARQLFENAEHLYQREALRCLTDPRGVGIFREWAGWWELAHAQILRREAWQVVQGHESLDDPLQHLIQARGYRLIGEIEKADRELAAAVAAGPDDNAFWQTVGIAHYRTGNWKEAIAALERSCRLETATNGQGNAWQRLFLAMSHWQLGRQEEAFKFFNSAIELDSVWSDEVSAYRDEAAALLGPVSQQKLAALRRQPWEQQLDQLPHDSHWNSARMQLCREIAADDKLFGAVQQHRPGDADLSIARGQCLAYKEKWDEAAEWFGRVIAQRGLSEDACQAACLHLLTDRSDAYRQFCTKLIRQAGEVTDPNVAFVLARACIIVPEMAASPEQVVSWAEQAVSRERSPWGLHVLGAACCRAGQYSRAIELLEESSASNWGFEGKALNALVQSIAQTQQGNSTEAADCLGRARALMARAYYPPPPDWMEYHVLVREVEASPKQAIPSPNANPAEDAPETETTADD